MFRRSLLLFPVLLALSGSVALAQSTNPITVIPNPTTAGAGSASAATPGGNTSAAEPPSSPPATQPAGEAKLEARVQGLEKQLEGLSKHLTVTTAGGDVKLILGGAVIADLLFNDKRPAAPGTPFLLAPGSPSGLNQNTFDGNARQTTIFVKALGPTLGADWHTSALVAVNLYDSSVIADQYGLLPLMAYAEIGNSFWRFGAGLQHDIFGPLDPTTLAFSKLMGAGNAGAYRLNASATRYLHLSDSSQVNVIVGISEPVTTIINNQNLGVLEDNGWPNVESRVALALGPLVGAEATAVRPIEIGLSGVIGQMRQSRLFVGRNLADVWGVGGDFRAAFTERFGCKGEVYHGQALGEYNGGIFQSLGPVGQAVRSTGGWAEVYFFICPETLHTHVGYGIDDPLNSDLGILRPIRNDVIFANLIWEATKQIRVACEFTYRKTGYVGLPDNQGFGIHTQFQWRF